MTSSGPYSQSYNFTHMFDFTDLRGRLPRKEPCPESIMGIIKNNPDFHIFNFLIKRADLESIYNSLQADFTVFVPSDKFLLSKVSEDVFANMDILTARTIVKTLTLDTRISGEILEDSPASYLYTTLPENRLYITNIGGVTYINGNIKIIKKDIVCNNGVIHVIDGIFIPNII